MTFAPDHFGLYFTRTHVEQARQARDREPYQSAWNLLHSREPKGDVAGAQWNGFLYRFSNDEDAGSRALALLTAENALRFDAETRYLDRLAITLTWAQTFEMLRDYPAFSQEAQAKGLARFSDTVEHLNRTVTTGFRNLWLQALNLAAGIVLERQDLFQTGVQEYQRAVREDIHPEGYVRGAVESGDGLGFYRQMRSVQALVLMAEAAQHAGVDLWGYTVRGVSLMTTATYVMYYHFRPDKWRWDEGLEAVIPPFFRKHAGFMEMVNRRDNRPRDIQRLLDDLRPIYDVYGGGLTTLTHGLAAGRHRLFR
jgi:hypothetical protein